MTRARNSGVLRIIPLLISVCLLSFPAEAETRRYRFLSEQSTLVQTGGIAGIDRTYTITGTFELTSDFEAGTALFSQVDASAVCSIPSRSGKTEHYSLDPNEVFNMTSLAGVIVDGDESIRFDGTADDGSSVQITLTLADGSVSLKGETVPPPGSADFFIYTLDALAEPKHEYSSGSGTADDPYRICTTADLIGLGKNPEDYDKHFILMADIDLDPNLPGRKVFDKAVIAPDTHPTNYQFDGTAFTGMFDGNGHTISHLAIEGEDYLGLFGKLGLGAEVKNLGVLEVSIAGSGNSVGGLVGNNSGSIATSYSTGAVSGIGFVGGLVGDNSGSITTSSSTATVSGEVRVGGLAGYNSGIITTSYSTGTVTGGYFSGGLVGDNVGWGELGVGIITASYSTGAVSGWTDVGGLVGRSQGGSIAVSFWDMETSGQSSSAGGTGLTTAEMKDINTFLNAGWDFVSEIHNGTEDIWWILEGRDYPRLWWELPAKYSGGMGEPNDPYQIATAEDLMLLGESPEDYDKHFILTADIDLDPNLPGRKVFHEAVIGNFNGVFDGKGHNISHLTIAGGGNLGLFGELSSGARISNLTLEDVDVNGTGAGVGSLASSNSGSISTSYSRGKVSGGSDVKGRSYVGGLAGSSSGIITTSYSNCSVSGTDSLVGGLVGSNSGSIATSYSTGAVRGKDEVGGLVGSNSGSIITSYCTGNVSGNESVGGLVGINYGGCSMSYSTGRVKGNKNVGGLVGKDYGGSIISSFWDMETSGRAISAVGTGLTTAEMQDIDTYLNAGWDFVDENRNGTCDYWQISPGDYPRLRYHFGESPTMPEGLGTPQKPYLIRDARDLGTVWFKPSAHYRLEASVDLSGTTWSMAVVPWFEGIFDGNGYIISNLHIEGGGPLGLFGRLSSEAKISNLGLEAVDVNGIDSGAGGLVCDNNGSISNSYITGTVTGTWVVGGIAGGNSGSITTSYSTCTVRGRAYIGGFVGGNGLSELPMGRGILTSCYSTGAVYGDYYVGGLAGANGGSIASSYSTGKASGNEEVGGLVGYSYGSITSSYSTGTVEGTKDVGGLLGNNHLGNSKGSIAASFWDIETSGCDRSAGGTGLTTAEMQEVDTYLNAGWDFVDENRNGTCNYWQISTSDYPRLHYLTSDGPVMPEGLGTAEQSYLIRDARDLGTVWFKPSAHYRLEEFVDLSGITWPTAVVPWFEGTFDGNGYTVSNLHIQGGGNLGLFGQLASGAKICNLGLEAVEINGTGDFVGGLAGINDDGGGVTSSYSTGTITGNNYVGGLVGSNSVFSFDMDSYTKHGSIAASYSTGTVTGNERVGGLVGDNWGSIAASYSMATVTGNEDVGGLVGSNMGYSSSSITSSYSTGTVSGNGDVGGLVGANIGRINACFWNAQTSGQATSAGGMGRTTAEMQTASTFLQTGWDFVGESVNGTWDIWRINEGLDYPRLICQFVIGDFDGNAKVGFRDFAIFAGSWLATDSSFFYADGGTDLTNDGKVNFNDLREFAENWLQSRRIIPPEPPEPPPPPPPEPPPPPKGRGCFPADTPVWVNGALVEISNVASGQMVGGIHFGPAIDRLEQIETVEEHEGTFECRDIVFESGNRISVVDVHCFMLDSGRWIAAQDLRSGLRLKTLGDTVGIKSVAKRAAPFGGKVYNLKIKGADQYFVGKDRVIVRDY